MDRICNIEGCDKKHTAKDYCQMHYKRWKHNGDPNISQTSRSVLSRICSVEGCNKKYYVRDYCETHFELVYRPNKRMNCKIETFKCFGGKCIICGEDDIDVLNLDHVNDDGYKEKDENGKRQGAPYKEILDDFKNNGNLKEKYQILCANCNTKKRVYRNEFNRLEKLGLPPF